MADPVEPVIPVSDGAPAASTAPQDSVAPASSAAPPTSVETPAVETPAAAVDELKVEPGLLEKFDEAKAAQEGAAAEKAKTEPPAAEEPKKDAASSDVPAESEQPKETVAEAPKIEWKFELPETLKADDGKIAEFTGILDGLLAPKEGETPTQYAQKLIDLHTNAMQDYAKQTLANQFKVFNDTKAGWEKRVLADPEIGGSGHDTAIAAVARVRDRLVSSEVPGTKHFNKAKYDSDWKEFGEFLTATGASSHPAMIRLLHNAARFVDEPQASSLPSEIRPPKDIGKPPGKGADTLYDHPRSPRNGS